MLNFRVVAAVEEKFDAARALAAGDVALCSASLLVSSADLERTHQVLAPAELIRLARMKNADLARRYTVGRGKLRILLGGVLGCAPQQLEIVSGAHGKPVIADRSAAERLFFNVSHCEDAIVIALSQTGAVGVDVERVRAVANWEAIARRALPPDAVARCLGPDAAQSDTESRFLSEWCLHEASLKVSGAGWSRHELVSAADANARVRTKLLTDCEFPAEIVENGQRYLVAVAHVPS